jgi:hypothetical protein
LSRCRHRYIATCRAKATLLWRSLLNKSVLVTRKWLQTAR